MEKVVKESLDNAQCGDWFQIKDQESDSIVLIGEIIYIRKQVTTDVKLIIKIIQPKELRGEDFIFYSKDESYLIPLGNPRKNPWLRLLFS